MLGLPRLWTRGTLRVHHTYIHIRAEGISRFNMTGEKRTDKQMSSGQNSGEKAPAFTKPLTICVTNS